MIKNFNNSYFFNNKLSSVGVIFFIQRWSELTYEKTIDSYQYSIMNPVTSLKENLKIINNILNGTYPTLDNLIDSKNELIRIIKEDWIIKKYNVGLYNNILYMANLKIDSKSESSKIANIKNIRSKIIYQLNLLETTFNQWIKIELLDAVEDMNFKAIDYLSNVLVSQCIDIGWSKKGLNKVVRNFVNKDTNDIDLLKAFLNMLFSPKDTYHVYLKIANTYNLESLKIWSQKFNFLLSKGEFILEKYSPSLRTFLTLKPEDYYLEVIVSSKDSTSASLIATDMVKKMMELLTFHNKLKPWSPDTSTYYLVKNNEYVEVLPSNQIFSTSLYIESSNTVFDDTLEIFTEDNKVFSSLQTKLQSVYSYFNISKLAKYREEEYLNMWIGLESFMNTGNYNNIIAHIKNVLPSVLCKRYIYRLIRNLCEDLQRCSIDLSLSTGIIDLTNFNKQQLVKEVISALKNEVSYREILHLSKVNSLLIYRIENIHELITDDIKIYEKLIRYSDTVLWHVQRLYRLRNDITHSGYLTDYDITPYIEHLHNFTAALILEVIYVVMDDNLKLVSVGDILTYLRDTFEAYKDYPNSSLQLVDTGIVDLSCL